MYPTLKGSLCDVIDEWIADNCESAALPQNFIFPDTLAERMTDAAAAVFDGIAESQKYNLDQEYVVESVPETKKRK